MDNGKVRWPTLEGRRRHSLKTRKDAVKQLQKCGLELTDLAKKVLYLDEPTAPDDNKTN